MTWKVYNDVHKVDAEWNVAGERFRTQNVFMMSGAVLIPLFIGWSLSHLIGIAAYVIAVILGLAAATWVMIITVQMNAKSRLPTLAQWRLMKNEAKNNPSRNFTME